MKSKIVIGIFAIFFAIILVGTNGLAMKDEMVKVNAIGNTIDLELAFNYHAESDVNQTVGAVSDFNSDNGTHDSMMIITYNQTMAGYYMIFSTYNETDGLVVWTGDIFRDEQIYLFEPRNNTAVLNDTLYWVYAAEGGFGACCGKDPPVINELLIDIYLGYYVDSGNYSEQFIYETVRFDALNFSIVIYQGFFVWSIGGAILYFTGLDTEPTYHPLIDTEGCQCNCIYQDALYFASDDHLYQMNGSILDPEWATYDIRKSNQEVTALDVYIDDEGVSHLIICYSNDSTIYEFLDEEVVPLIEMPATLNIETIENTRNYNGSLFVSGITQDDTGFIAQVLGADSYANFEITTPDADANVMCNLTSAEELYVFNAYNDDSDFDAYHYTGTTLTPPAPSEGEGITITLTEAGYWETGDSTDELYEYVGHAISVKARVQCADGIDTVILYYKNVGDTSYTTLAMTRTSGTATNGIYSGTIPAQDETGDVPLKIKGTSDLAATHTTPVYTLDIIQAPQAPATPQGGFLSGLPYPFNLLSDQCCLLILLVAIAIVAVFLITRYRK